MKFLLIVLLVVLFFANARAINEDTKNYLLRDQWEAFKTKFGFTFFFLSSFSLCFTGFFVMLHGRIGGTNVASDTRLSRRRS